MTRYPQAEPSLRLPESGSAPEPFGNGDCRIEEAMRDPFLPSADFCSILDQLPCGKNAILHGPPGVGKTFIAPQVAYATIGRKSPSRAREQEAR